VSDAFANPKAEPRVALVTGASSGLGAAIAVALGRLGWPVALGARRGEKLEQVAQEVEAAGGKALAHPLDVTDAGSVEAFVAAAETRLGPVDALVSNAGIARAGKLPELAVEDVQAELETNLLGPLRVVKRVLPGMLERQRGDVCFVTSLNAVVPRPFQLGYTASKAGLEAAARTLQMELEGSGVRATIVRPGPTQTEMGWDWDPRLQKELLEEWSRWGILRHMDFMTPESVAEGVVAAVTAPPGVHLDLIQLTPEKKPAS
jgi:NADP-dependent 3-hydroxy acid dehydrogenase YdfG